MSVLDAGVERLTPKVDLQQYAYNTITTNYISVDGTSFQLWNMHSGKLGSTNGTTYGTTSQIMFQLARRNFASFMFGFAQETPHDVDINMTIYQMWEVNVVPFYARDARSKLLSITIPQAFISFSVSDAVQADGGVVGGPTAAHWAHYRVSPGLACPTIGIEFTSLSSAPTTGSFFAFEVCRAS